MAEDLPITHARLDLIVERLAAIEQSLAIIEGLLELMNQRLTRLELRRPTLHYGVGRGGRQEEEI